MKAPHREGYIVETLSRLTFGAETWWGSDGPEDDTAAGRVHVTIADALEAIANSGPATYRVREYLTSPRHPAVVWRGMPDDAARWYDELAKEPEDRDPCWREDGSDCDCSPCCRARRDEAASEAL